MFFPLQPKISEKSDPVISLFNDSEQQGVKPVKHVNKIVIGSDPNNIQGYLAAKSPNKQLETQGEHILLDIKKPSTDDTSQTTVVPTGEIFGETQIELHPTVNGEDLSSDTDSGVESEKKVSLDDSPKIGRAQELESSDTDSWGTPATSPAKGREPSPPSSPISSSLNLPPLCGVDLCKYQSTGVFLLSLYSIGQILYSQHLLYHTI